MGGRAASCKFANCDDGVNPFWLPKGLIVIIVDIARLNLLGVLLKLSALPTFTRVFEANLLRIQRRKISRTVELWSSQRR